MFVVGVELCPLGMLLLAFRLALLAVLKLRIEMSRESDSVEPGGYIGKFTFPTSSSSLIMSFLWFASGQQNATGMRYENQESTIT